MPIRWQGPSSVLEEMPSWAKLRYELVTQSWRCLILFYIVRFRCVLVSVLLAFLRAITDLIPVSRPFLAPAKRSIAFQTDLVRQIEFFMRHF